MGSSAARYARIIVVNNLNWRNAQINNINKYLFRVYIFYENNYFINVNCETKKIHSNNK